MNASRLISALGTGVLLLISALTAGAEEVRTIASVNLNIASQPLGNALNEFGQQSGLQVVFFYSDIDPGLTSPRLAGKYSPKVALEQLLANTSLAYKFINSRTVAIVAKRDGVSKAIGQSVPATLENQLRVANASDRDLSSSTKVAAAATSETAEASLESEKKSARASAGIPDMIVEGARTLNADIKRTRDDIQPYVVFDAAQIENSLATTVEEFLRVRLPMNTQQGTIGQDVNALDTLSNRSQFNLRGLGTNQTLVLVDGRRLPGTYASASTGGFNFNQGDLNGIPIAAVERIEVLPATASGIYGGGATGGVINIILKRDYTGLEVKGTYGNTTGSDAASRRLDVTGGYQFEGGRSRLMVAGSHSDANPLLAGERDFAARGRAMQFANNPAVFLNPNNPPSGYTSNIRNASPNQNTNLVLDNGTVLSSPRVSVPIGYAGPASDGGNAFVQSTQYNLNLPNDTGGGAQALLVTPTVDTLSLNLRREFTSRFQAFIDGSWQRNESETYGNGLVTRNVRLAANAPNNPFTTTIIVNYPAVGLSSVNLVEDETWRATGGFIVKLPHDWSSSVDYVWSKVRSTTTYTVPSLTIAGSAALANGTLNIMRDLNAQPLDFSPYLRPSPNNIVGPVDIVLDDATLRTAGPIFKLPGGPATLTAALEYRKEEAEDAFGDQLGEVPANNVVFYTPARSQSVNSYYLEANLPVISSVNSARFARALAFQASVRHDDYKTHSVSGSDSFLVPSRDGPLPDVRYGTNKVQATKYTVGLRYAPLDDVVLRTSYGTGFLPPSISQVVSNLPVVNTAVFGTLTDPRRGGGLLPSSGTLISGGNSSLRPEESTNFSVGAIFTPRFAPDLRISVDYLRIRKTDEITTLGPQDIVNLESLFPDRIVRGANLPGDPVGWAGPITSIDYSLVNIFQANLEAFDTQIDYALKTDRFGRFDFYTVATVQTHLERQYGADQAFLDSVGYTAGVLKWRGNAGVTWNLRGWTAGSNVQYYDSYLVYAVTTPAAQRATAILNQGSTTIPSQTYVDLFFGYSFGKSQNFAHGMLADSKIVAGVQNIFDKSPPILATTGAGGYSTYGDPRMRRYSISVVKSF